MMNESSDWRADGWHWRQTGSLHISFEGVECKKVYFYTKIGRTATARYKPEISKDFMREVYFHPLFPNRVLVIYSGDEKVAVTLRQESQKHPLECCRLETIRLSNYIS